MLKSFKQLAAEPDAPLKPQPANARDVVAWLQQAQVKLQDARQAAVSAGTRMDAAWDAVLLSSLAVACAEGWRATSDRGHHAVAFEGAAHAVGLGQARFDTLDALRDWRNRKYRAGLVSTADEAREAVALAEPWLADVATWFAAAHPALLKQGLAR
ncbi:hypothetical protein [Aquabacterium sp.]|uniref:hypothetical protein n=1 Tax=Aquabacterium sp. TaxID=1872578 RepID=UPI002C520D4B|nr:hypothetical protein [Aquabacterium sp.]HSW04189.1 hypothetical protein [Aquabacterium sp.]